MAFLLRYKCKQKNLENLNDFFFYKASAVANIK